MQRHIVHCDLDSFFVSVQRLQDSRLIGKPVIVGGFSDRAVVASCSYEARIFGVHSAMPMKLALRLCPDAIVVRGDHDLYSKYSDMVTEIIGEQVPVVEKASIDEHYLDLTGMDKFFGCWKWAQELRKHIIEQTGLPISFGMSSSKTVSKIATGESKPCGEKQVPQGQEKFFLAPLSVRKIPMVGDQSYMRLRNMGIAKCHTLQQMDVYTIRSILGENGVAIWKKANGEDNNPVVPFHEQKSISKETTYVQDTIDMDMLKRTLLKMADELAFELRTSKRLTGCITLKIRYSNFDTHTRQVRISYTNSERTIAEKAVELFSKLYSKRMLVRLVGVKLGHLINGGYQVDLFHDTEQEIQLSLAMDQIRMKYGIKSVYRCGYLHDPGMGLEPGKIHKT